MWPLRSGHVDFWERLIEPLADILRPKETRPPTGRHPRAGCTTRGAVAGASLALLLTCSVGAGMASAQTAGAPPSDPKAQGQAPSAGSDRYRLRPGDAIDIDFRFAPELNQSLVIPPDGFVSLRGVGEMRVADLSVPELTSQLKAAYGDFMREPVISVVLRDFDRPFVIVGGQVLKPGKYELRSETTVIEALSLAGGFAEPAKQSRVLLFRRNGTDTVSALEIDVKKMIKEGRLQANVYVRPGDLLYVPTSGFWKIERYLIYPAILMFLNPWIWVY